MFNAPRKSPAAHHPGIHAEAWALTATGQDGDFSQRPILVLIGDERQKYLGGSQIGAPATLRVTLSIEVELVGLIHQLESPGIQWFFGESDSQLGIGLL